MYCRFLKMPLDSALVPVCRLTTSSKIQILIQKKIKVRGYIPDFEFDIIETIVVRLTVK